MGSTSMVHGLRGAKPGLEDIRVSSQDGLQGVAVHSMDLLPVQAQVLEPVLA